MLDGGFDGAASSVALRLAGGRAAVTVEGPASVASSSVHLLSTMPVDTDQQRGPDPAWDPVEDRNLAIRLDHPKARPGLTLTLSSKSSRRSSTCSHPPRPLAPAGKAPHSCTPPMPDKGHDRKVLLSQRTSHTLYLPLTCLMMGKRGIDMMDIARRRKEAARRLVMGWH